MPISDQHGKGCIYCPCLPRRTQQHHKKLPISGARSNWHPERAGAEGGATKDINMRKGLASSNSSRRRLSAALILAFNIFKGEVDLNPFHFFLRPPRDSLRGHTYRLVQGPSRLRRRSGAFSVRDVKHGTRLPAHLVLSPSVSIFKNQLDRQWSEIFPAAPV